MTLQEFFLEYPKVAIAFSGGVDSAYLLYAAKSFGADVTAYYVRSLFQPEFEYRDALRVAQELQVEMKVLDVDVLSAKEVTQNPKNRCYYCKQVIFHTILNAALQDGYTVLLDGTNASDDADDRPGMKALEELAVFSPLRICSLTKTQIRQYSKEAGLFTWDKPSYACLATRIRTGEEITAEKLRATEEAENFLFSLGMTNFRVRRIADTAKLQVPEEQIDIVLSHRKQILEKFKEFYDDVLLDLEVRK